MSFAPENTKPRPPKNRPMNSTLPKRSSRVTEFALTLGKDLIQAHLSRPPGCPAPRHSCAEIAKGGQGPTAQRLEPSFRSLDWCRPGIPGCRPGGTGSERSPSTLTTVDAAYALSRRGAASELSLRSARGESNNFIDPNVHQLCSRKVQTPCDVRLPTRGGLSCKPMVSGFVYALVLVLAAEFVIDEDHAWLS
jgi:hypothetical protein